MNEQIKKAVEGFRNFVMLGWETQLALECCYDGVYNIIEMDDFITLCQNEIKESGESLENNN